jgi:hypothetical protein
MKIGKFRLIDFVTIGLIITMIAGLQIENATITKIGVYGTVISLMISAIHWMLYPSWTNKTMETITYK